MCLVPKAFDDLDVQGCPRHRAATCAVVAAARHQQLLYHHVRGAAEVDEDVRVREQARSLELRVEVRPACVLEDYVPDHVVARDHVPSSCATAVVDSVAVAHCSAESA